MPEACPEDQEIVKVYQRVRHQVIAGSDKRVYLNHLAVKMEMDLYGVQDQRRCLEQVVKLFNHFQS